VGEVPVRRIGWLSEEFDHFFDDGKKHAGGTSREEFYQKY
jgi:hypothetical protein